MNVKMYQRNQFWEYVKMFIAKSEYLSKRIKVSDAEDKSRYLHIDGINNFKSKLEKFNCTHIDLSVSTRRRNPCVWYLIKDNDINGRDSLLEIVQNHFSNNNIAGISYSVDNENGNEDGRIKFIITRHLEENVETLKSEANKLVYLLRKSVKAISSYIK